MANEKIVSKFATNPADLLSEAGRQFLKEENLKRQIRVCLPAIVETFNGSTVDVQTAISIVAANGETIDGPLLKNVPVKMTGGGGFAVYIPLKKGDTGWLIFADKDISIFKQNRKKSPPNTYRLHDWEDAIFIPDAMDTAQIAQEDKSNLVLQSLDGAVKISVSSSAVNVKGNMAIDGDLSVSGTISADGDITSSGDIVTGTISLKSHIHGGVTTGSGTTGTPQ